MSVSMWSFFAVVLFLQNFSFTFVSRARNSGSLKRHLIAAAFSNGIWFASQFMIFGQLLTLITGKQGWAASIFTGVFYATFTVAGSIAAHYYALKTEKGKGAVGANSKYAQFTALEGEKLRRLMEVIHCADLDEEEDEEEEIELNTEYRPKLVAFGSQREGGDR